MNFKLITALAVGLLSTTPAYSAILDFEGVTSFASIGGFYNGGTDSAGASGPNLGISFGGDALALSNDVLGPYYSNAPTPGTIMTVVGADAALNASAGFSGASFYYSSSEATSVSVFSGLNGTGTLLGLLLLGPNAQGNFPLNAQNSCSDSPFCHWDLASLSFAGVAHSIQFGSTANIAGFDNLTLVPTPLPAAVWLMLSGLAGLMTLARRKQIG